MGRGRRPARAAAAGALAVAVWLFLVTGGNGAVGALGVPDAVVAGIKFFHWMIGETR